MPFVPAERIFDMPLLRSKADAEFVRKAAPFKCAAPVEDEGGTWYIEVSQKLGIAAWSEGNRWLDIFISGMYAERDRAEKGAGA